MTLSAFHKKIILTLPDSVERHRHITQELDKYKIDDYSFEIGVHSDSPEVLMAFAERRVFSQSVCFRCGLERCQHANNILLKQQIACFISYKNIFVKAASSDYSTFLVMEDDIVFNQNYEKLLKAKAFDQSTLDALGFYSKQPVLLKMGKPQVEKNKNAEAFAAQDCWEIDTTTMSNTMFGFNRPFAELFCNSLAKFMTTSDKYIHNNLASRCSSYALRSKIVNDLSWSTKKIPSTIIPKKPSALQLAKPLKFWNTFKKQATFTKKYKLLEFLITGVPRGGTKWASEASKALGYDILHEQVGLKGSSSWMYATNFIPEQVPFAKDFFSKNPYFLRGQKKILIVRKLAECIGSQIIENTKNPQSLNYRLRIIFLALGIDLSAEDNQILKL